MSVVSVIFVLIIVAVIAIGIITAAFFLGHTNGLANAEAKYGPRNEDENMTPIHPKYDWINQQR